MKRSGPLARKTPLRSTGNLRRTPMKAGRASAADFPADVKAMVKRRSMGICEIRTAGCQRIAVHFHHRKLRSAGGQGTFDNCLHVCTSCHDFAHANRAAAVENGWIVPSWGTAAG